MQRRTFDPQDTPWNPPNGTLDAGSEEGACEADGGPTPGELFFQTGIVLAVALCAGVVVQLVMGAA